MRKHKIMSPEKFDSLLPSFGKLSLDTVDIARRVLVIGESQAALAKERGFTRQHINRVVNRVRAIANEIPDGWEHVEIYLPSELASKVRAMAKEAKKITRMTCPSPD